MHVIFIEPAFPRYQRQFVRGIHAAGGRVTGIGEAPFEALDGELQHWLYRYERVSSVVHEEALLERGREIAERLRVGCEGISARTGRIVEIRERGLMIALELKDDADASLTIRTHRELLRRGFILARRPGLNVLRIDPPLTIDREDVESFLDNLEAVLTERP